MSYNKPMQIMEHWDVEPLCGWEWIQKHRHDLDNYVPEITIKTEHSKLKLVIKDKQAIKAVVEMMRNDKCQ